MLPHVLLQIADYDLPYPYCAFANVLKRSPIWRLPYHNARVADTGVKPRSVFVLSAESATICKELPLGATACSPRRSQATTVPTGK